MASSESTGITKQTPTPAVLRNPNFFYHLVGCLSECPMGEQSGRRTLGPCQCMHLTVLSFNLGELELTLVHCHVVQEKYQNPVYCVGLRFRLIHVYL